MTESAGVNQEREPLVMVPVVAVADVGQPAEESAVSDPIIDLIDDAATVRAEFAEFKRRTLKAATKEAQRRGWCDEMYDVLREVGFTDDELPLTHAKVRITLELTVPLPRKDDLDSLDAYCVERYLRNYFADNDLEASQFEILTKPRPAAAAVNDDVDDDDDDDY